MYQFKEGLIRVKRTIILCSLVLSIIGTLSFLVIANTRGNKDLNMNMTYVVGDKSSLGEVQIKQEIFKGDYAKKMLLINKDGVKNEEFKLHFNDEGDQIRDKKLFRGIEWGSFGEDENFSAILQIREKEGLLVRYKNNNEYKEFTIKNNIINGKKGEVYNTIVKDGEVYAVYNNDKYENFLIKINLTSKTMVESIRIPTDKNMWFSSKNIMDKLYVVKDNKVYMYAHKIDESLRVFCYDFLSKNLTYKDIEINISGRGYCESQFIDRKIYLINFQGDNTLRIISYDILMDEKKSMTINLPQEYYNTNIFVDQLKETEDSFYLCGYSIKVANEHVGYIMKIDKKAKAIKYLSKLDESPKFNYRLILQ